jgi:uncharacterized membrane protein
MYALAFFAVVAAVFGCVLALETAPGASGVRRPIGLFVWISSGNWPAKIGGGLLILGVGALLRYAMLNVDVPPQIKLASGILASAALGFASMLYRAGANRRAVSLALAGAAFGTAYLTAYSAYAVFGYVPGLAGLALLGLTCVATGVFAVTRGALSIALLAMVGAYLAPAFAIGSPGPVAVYGYYLAASLLTLGMVMMRGWRPLIHLSFLFTLAGGGFLAWTSQYFSPVYSETMQPLLLLLVAVHLVMPVLEQRAPKGGIVGKLDQVYLCVLPAVAAAAMLAVAPTRLALSGDLAVLAAAWLAVAAWRRIAAHGSAAFHALVAVLFIGLSAAAYFDHLPWRLVALAIAVAALAFSVHRPAARGVHSLLAGAVLLFGALQVLESAGLASHGMPLLNGVFVERLVTAALLVYAGYLCRRAGQVLDTLLLFVGTAWGCIAAGMEIVRWDLPNLALILHWGALTLLGVTLLPTGQRWLRLTEAPLAIAALVTALFAMQNTSAVAAWITAGFGTLLLLAVFLRRRDDGQLPISGYLAAIGAPLLAGIWAYRLGLLDNFAPWQLPAAAGAGVLLLAVHLSRFFAEQGGVALRSVGRLYAAIFIGLLAASTLIEIARSTPAVVLEFICVAGLVSLAWRGLSARWLPAACAIAAAVFLQAQMLRAFGPDGNLTLDDIGRMRLPALLSLLWAVLGALMAGWGRRSQSRPQWIAGAVLLVCAAVKLVLFDFGSLGQLGNILAVIAAGVVFLLVGWFAPMPPAHKQPVAPPPDAPPQTWQTATREPPARVAATAAKKTAPLAAAGTTAKREAVDAAAPGGIPEQYWNRPASTGHGEAAAAPTAAVQSDGTGAAVRITFLVLAALAGLAFLSRCAAIPQLLGIGREIVRPAAAPLARAEPPPVASAPAPESAPAVQGPPPKVETECTQWLDSLPSEFVVHAAGAYRGKQLDFPLGSSNHVATEFSVTVNDPGHDVVLVLAAYEPSIWTIRREPETRIAGLWLTGYHQQEVIGLPDGTPLLNSAHDSGSVCPRLLIGADNAAESSAIINGFLGRGPQSYVVASNGRAHLGKNNDALRYVQDGRGSAAAFRDPSTPLAGDKGIADYLRQGSLRKATQADLDTWKRAGVAPRDGSAALSGMRDLNDRQFLFRTYVVLRPITFPAGLYGAHSATFLVPRGVSAPLGEPGHSTVLDLNR